MASSSRRKSATQSLFEARNNQISRMASIKLALRKFNFGNRKFDRSSSEHDLNKQNVFNGSVSLRAAGSDTDFDAGYTEQLRRLSKNQQYVRSPSEVTKPSPTQQQPPTGPRSATNQSYYHSPQSSHSNLQSAVSGSPHHSSTPYITNSSSVDSYLPKSNPRVTIHNNNNDILPSSRQQVLETDIDEPSSPEVQPPPPPRRHTVHYDSQKPPPKPPKMMSTIAKSDVNQNSQQSAPTTDDTPVKVYAAPERTERNNEKEKQSPKPQQRRLVELSHHSTEELHKVSSAPQLRKDRRSESMVHASPKGEDMTVTSGDPSIHIQRRHSVNRLHHKHSKRSNSSSSLSKEDSKSADAAKLSPSVRSQQRETEFPAIEKAVSEVVERLNPQSVNNVINENRPKPVPFDRYHPMVNGSTPVNSPAASVTHSRQVSADLLDSGSALKAEPPVAVPRPKETMSPTPPPRSPKLSSPPTKQSPPLARTSSSSLSDSRKSTPSPHSNSSDVAKAKSDPSTPIDKSFVPISTEILAELADQGIDISGNAAKNSKCISDESKARLVKMTAISSPSPPPSPTRKTKAPTVKHIRQKSSDEILCDTQVEHLGKSIKDETLSQVLSKPQRGTTDYLPGLFDDVLTKDIPRKQRQSLGESPCHSKQNSEGDSLSFSKPAGEPVHCESPLGELNTVQEKKDEIVLVLRKKLEVLQDDQRFRQQEVEDNDDCGAKIVELVETKCNDREVKKYKSYIEDVEKITKLLLKLSRRLARAENELRNAPMDATDDDKKSLEQKRNNLQRQHNDAKALKESIDRRKAQVAAFLHRSLDDGEFQQYDDFISIKLKLIMESSDLEDQISHCEEQIAAVTAITS